MSDTPPRTYAALIASQGQWSYEMRDLCVELERENAAMREAIRDAHDALFGLSNWRNDCDAYDEDMGYPQRDYDEEQVEMMEETAQRSLSKLQPFLKP